MAKTGIFSIRLKEHSFDCMEEYILDSITYDLDNYGEQYIKITPKNLPMPGREQFQLLLKAINGLQDRWETMPAVDDLSKAFHYCASTSYPLITSTSYPLISEASCYVYLCVLTNDSILSYKMRFMGFRYNAVDDYLYLNLMRVHESPTRIRGGYSIYKRESTILENLSLGSIPLPNIMPDIERIIFNDPATIVFWTDETKTIVKAHDEEFSEEHGLAMAIAKKFLDISGEKYPRAAFKRLIENADRYTEE